MKKETIENLYGNSEASYYRWKKEKRPIISLVEKYFYEEELIEFIETGKISRMEILLKIHQQEYSSLTILNQLKYLEINNSIIKHNAILADYAYFIYQQLFEFNEKLNLEKLKIKYIIHKNTVLDEQHKIYLFSKYQIKFEFLSLLVQSISNDCYDILVDIHSVQKSELIEILKGFIFPSLYRKYHKFEKIKNKYQINEIVSIDFSNYLNKFHELEKYKEIHEFKKQEILDTIESFVHKIKTNGA